MRSCGLQQAAHYLTGELVLPAWQSEGQGFPVLFWDIDAAGRSEPVPLVSHQLDDLTDHFPGHAIRGAPAGTRRHRSLVGVDVPVCQQVLILIEAPGAGSAGRGSHGRRSLTATATTTAAAQAPRARAGMAPAARPSRPRAAIPA